MKEVKKRYDNTFRMMYVSTISTSPASEVCHNGLLPSSPLLVAVRLRHRQRKPIRAANVFRCVC